MPAPVDGMAQCQTDIVPVIDCLAEIASCRWAGRESHQKILESPGGCEAPVPNRWPDLRQVGHYK